MLNFIIIDDGFKSSHLMLFYFFYIFWFLFLVVINKPAPLLSFLRILQLDKPIFLSFQSQKTSDVFCDYFVIFPSWSCCRSSRGCRLSLPEMNTVALPNVMKLPGGHKGMEPGPVADAGEGQRGREEQAVLGRFIRSGEIPKMVGDSCHRAQYCPNEVS